MASKESDKTVAQQLQTFGTNSTVHGVSHVADVQRCAFRRVIWCFLLLSSAAYFLYIATNRLAKYNSHPTATRLRVIDKKPTVFPAVTICNMNLIRKSYAEKDPFLLDVMRSLKDDPKSTVAISQPETIKKFDELYNLGTVFAEGAHQLSDTIRGCKWHGTVITNVSEYITPLATQMGHCFTFGSYEYIRNTGQQLVTTRIGIDGGLQLTLDVKQDEYFYQEKGRQSAGFKVLIHSPDTWPLISDVGTAISPGTETYLAVGPVLVHRLNSEVDNDRRCVSADDASFENNLEFVDKYSKEGCVYNCLVKHVIHDRKCDCRPWYLHAEGYEDCNFEQYLGCVFNASNEYRTNITILESCDCVDTCVESYYKVSKSEALYPSDLAMEDLAEYYGLNATYFRSNIIELKIYFEALSYEFVEEYESYTLGDLQSDIGGNLGLCLGASFLSLAEFGEIFLLLMMSMCRKIFRSNTESQK